MTPGTPDRHEHVAGTGRDSGECVECDARIAPVGAGADAHAGGKPDPDLLDAVTATLPTGCMNWPTCAGCNDERNATAREALAAAGRVLAQRLWAKANEVQVAIDNAGSDTADRRRWINMESTYRLAANLVLAACGVPEGDEGAAT